MISTTIKHTLRYRIPSIATKTTLRNLSSSPITVKVSPSEVKVKSLTCKNLELATRALHRDGLVVLEDVIDHGKLDFLNKKMVEDALFLQSAGDESPYNYNKGNIQQDPPATKKYLDPSIFLNPLATQLTTSLLGPKPRLSFLSGNSALPPTEQTPPQSQPVHSDADFAHPHCPFALVINIPLVTMTPENGSTEVWLGTHAISSEDSQEGKHGERASGRIKKDFLLERQGVRAPVQPVVKKGSVVVRDLRLWHAGMPNFSRNVRVMLAMIHFSPWFRNQMKVEISEDLRPLIEGYEDVLQIQAEFMPEKQILDRYLARGFGNSYDFDQADRLEIDI